jgi:hypothetical protein
MTAYSKIYLEDAMANLAAMMDYGSSNYGGTDAFYDRFLVSNISKQFGKGNPKYVCGMSGIELAEKIVEETGGTPVHSEYKAIRNPDVYWTGWILAYMQWYSGLPFKTLADKGIDPGLLMRMYPTHHEADISKTTDILKTKL